MKRILVFSWACACFTWGTASASIDTNGGLFSTGSNSTRQALTMNTIPAGKEAPLTSTGHLADSLELSPLAMNRDLSIMTHFSVLPQDYQMTVKQFLLSYESGDKMDRHSNPVEANPVEAKIGAKVEAEVVRIEKADGQRQAGSVSMSAPFLPVDALSEMFVEVDGAQSHSTGLAGWATGSSDPVTVGARGKGSFGKVEWESEFAYEDYLAADVIGSPAFKAALYGTIKLNTGVPSEFNVNLIHAGKRSLLEEELRYLDKKRTGGVFSPIVSNLSVVNTQLACNPHKNVFLSVDYYYYLQNELKVQSYATAGGASEGSVSEMAWTNGENSQLGEELNLKAIYAYSEACRSQLLAGWFDPGPAYGKLEDTKTFEIRGEIIVNF